MRISDWSSDVCSSDLAAAVVPEPVVSPSVISWDEVSDGAALGLELGYALIGLVDERKGAPLMTRITGIRRQLSRELGFVIPLVRVRDNLALGPNSYRITVAGVICAEAEIYPEDLLALDPGPLLARIPGTAVRDRTFGL